MIKRKTGILFVISAPSGAGKSTLCKRLLSEVSGIEFSVSFTTRAPRSGEVHGRDYFFITREEFMAMVNRGDFLEYAEVHGNLYGTSKSFVEEKLRKGMDLILDIDVQGAKQVFSKMKECVGIFIFPPSIEELRKRLIKRGTDPEDVIEKRLKAARWEIAQSHMYHYWILNDDLEEAYQQLKGVVLAERAKRERMELTWNI